MTAPDPDGEALARALWADEWQRSYHETPDPALWEQVPPWRRADLLRRVDVIRAAGWAAPEPAAPPVEPTCTRCGHDRDEHYDNTVGGEGIHATANPRGCTHHSLAVDPGLPGAGPCDCDGYEDPALDEPAEGPEDGHTWRIAVESRGSYAVESRTVQFSLADADYWTPSGEVEVRAWSLRRALTKAADLPLHAWPGHRDERWPSTGEPPAEPAVDAVVDALTVWLALPYEDAARVAGRIVTDLRRRGVIPEPEPAPAEPDRPYPNGTRVVHPEHGPGKVGSQAPGAHLRWVEFDREQGHGPLDIPVMRCVDVADLTPEGQPALVRVADVADLTPEPPLTVTDPWTGDTITSMRFVAEPADNGSAPADGDPDGDDYDWAIEFDTPDLNVFLPMPNEWAARAVVALCQPGTVNLHRTPSSEWRRVE